MGRAFVHYTGRDGNPVLAEFRATDGAVPAVLDPSTERQLLTLDDPYGNHNGGQLAFGPDGNLWMSLGDGGAGGDPFDNGQNPSVLLGKILRIDVDGGDPYGIPADNPFADGADGAPEVFLYGLRNPWRFSFDRETAALLIADVGQNAQEEIDYVPGERVCGNNFGWSAFEGTDRFNTDQEAPNAVAPILTYGRDGGCSVTGGYVVRDPALPALIGRYVYGDYCAGELRSFKPATPQARDDRSLGLDVPSLSSFGEDNAGHIYAVSLDGPVYRLAQ
jgi:glucose/arabinose dehydrogenase